MSSKAGIRTGMRAFTRDTYNRVKKFDRRDMQTWIESIYNEGYNNGKASVPGVDVEKIYEAIAQVKGIGPKKLEEIKTAVNQVLEGKG